MNTEPVLPPGTLLQMMYLKERLRLRPAGRFVEVGTGTGYLARTLLDLGWQGSGYDLSAEAIQQASERLGPELASGRMTLARGNWLDAPTTAPVDLVISSMVIEHLSDDDERRYFARCREALAPDGLAIVFVPASMRDWGIEDDIAGHLRRYSSREIASRLATYGWQGEHVAGLTWPLSNWLLPVSNWLVQRSEAQKQALSVQARTELSGHRHVPMKTSFHPMLRLLLNETTMRPFHGLQKLGRGRERSLVLYAECRPARSPG